MFNIYCTLEDATHSQPRVTALLACQDNLMPASWHMPVSKSPFRYAVAVREENYTHQLIQEKNSFTLNFLPFEYYETVSLMGKLHGDMDDKLAESNLDVAGEDRYKNVLLNASDFIYECVVCDTYKNGDHTIFIADVKKIHVNENQSAEPMLFSGRGKYATVGKTFLSKKGV
ncbi:MAG: flavin reductase [Sulfurovum sp.]|uniref:flavin reductase family protein n=1 Tax=Sulfurovum sp. TaxID=1969726 RepID=UPI0028681E8A|nr:flavin reductase family protein [Sulfurovum sp.]MCO4845118.1 flavin reductase [Sulfurovum sp.]